MGKSTSDFYELTIYEANLLATAYKEQQEEDLNHLAYAVYYGVGCSFSKKGFKEIRINKTKKTNENTKEALSELIQELGG